MNKIENKFIKIVEVLTIENQMAGVQRRSSRSYYTTPLSSSPQPINQKSTTPRIQRRKKKQKTKTKENEKRNRKQKIKNKKSEDVRNRMRVFVKSV